MRAAMSMAALALLAGCIEVRTTVCEDLVCPADRVCSEAHAQCVLPEQADACATRADGETCSFPGVSEGRCIERVCFATGCGNGFLEPGELCDDGNTFDGDGCSADCRSDETCGNGIIDQAVGERCDDGNAVGGDDCQPDCSLPFCGDGILDPGEECDDGNEVRGDGCNPQCSSNETCGNGIIDRFFGAFCGDVPCVDEQCDDGNDEVGDGCGTTCLIEACGNGVVDPGEVCDDGENFSGDGCSATCLSLEVCGNGILDAANGESCDDGNEQSQDGCSSQCTVELPTWNPSTPGRYAARAAPAAAYDPVRRRTVMFGGRAPGSPLNMRFDDTWEHDGDSWRQVFPATGPPPRDAGAMVYDAARRRVVLFGGHTGPSTYINDTWEFDGTDWREVTVTTPPPAVRDPAMAYDATRGVTVLVAETAGPDLETWTFDGTEWTRASTVGPSRRENAAVAYHATLGSVFLVGGFIPTRGYQRETWEWDGTAWTQLPSTSMPSGVFHMVYDAEYDELVSFGSRGDATVTSVFGGGSWSDLTTPNRPVEREEAAMVYDAHRRVVMFFGGTVGTMTGGVPFTDTWALDGLDWVQVAAGPYERSGAGGAFDERRGRPVVAGGLPATLWPVFQDTWEIVDGAWSRVHETLPRNLVSTRRAVFYDPTRRACVISAPTLAYDGGEWSDLALTGPTGPNASTYDHSRDVVVMVVDSATWELSGSTWTRVTTSGQPPPSPVLVYDVARARTLAVDETVWEYDPSASPPTWTDTGISGPPTGHPAAYNSSLGQVVVVGEDDLWTLEATGWRRWLTATTPPGARDGLLIDDPMHQRMLFLGDSSGDRNTWELRWSSGGADEVCDEAGDEDTDGEADCADPDCTGTFCGSNGEQCDAMGACTCPGGSTETSCGDGWDDDCDGDVDCDDADCAGGLYCSAESDCDDGLDDDGDGRTDCADPGCAATAPCEPFEQSCGDGVDNDGDGLTDCEDVDCFLVPCTTVL